MKLLWFSHAAWYVFAEGWETVDGSVLVIWDHLSSKRLIVVHAPLHKRKLNEKKQEDFRATDSKCRL